MSDDPVFQRVLIKLSGEALMGPLDYGTDPATVGSIADQLKVVHDRGVEIGIVLGAGNIYRGLSNAAEGKLKAWMNDVVLLNQVHVNADKYEGKTIEELRATLSGTTGENVVIRRFSRFAVGA